jgi:hypothetical protein
MKNFGKLAVLGAALAVSASYAHAIPVQGGVGIDASVDGAVNITSTGISFSPDSGTVNAASGTFVTTPTLLGDSAVLQNLTFSTGSGTELFAITGPPDVTFTLTSNPTIISDSPDPAGNLDITGFGTLTEAGYTSSAATFTLTASDNMVTSFEITAGASPVIPEPNSLMLLGTGLLSAGGMLMRRRRLTA